MRLNKEEIMSREYMGIRSPGNALGDAFSMDAKTTALTFTIELYFRNNFTEIKPEVDIEKIIESAEKIYAFFKKVD